MLNAAFIALDIIFVLLIIWACFGNYRSKPKDKDIYNKPPTDTITPDEMEDIINHMNSEKQKSEQNNQRKYKQ